MREDAWLFLGIDVVAVVTSIAWRYLSASDHPCIYLLRFPTV